MNTGKKSRWRLLLLTVPLAIVIGIWILTGQLNRWTGHFDPENAKDLARLRDIADEAIPLLDAIAQYRQVHGAWPSDLDVLVGEFLSASDLDARGWRGWTFVPEPDGFAVYYKLGWDPSLWYEDDSFGDGRWSYDPGDGSEATVIRVDVSSKSDDETS